MSAPPPKRQKTGEKEKTGVEEKDGVKEKTGGKEKTGEKEKTGGKGKPRRKRKVEGKENLKTGGEEKTGRRKKPRRKEKKSTRLYNQLRREGPPRKVDTGLLVDKDTRLPEEANKLNLWADAYVKAGCRTLEEIADQEQARLEQTNPSSAHRLPQPPPKAQPLQINVTYTHNHILSSSPFSNLSAGDISRNVQAIQTFNTPGLPAAPEKPEQSDSNIVDIPAIGLRCSVAEIPAPPALSYTADKLRDLVHDWDSGTRLQIKGAYVPLKYWSEVYAKHRGDIYSKRKEIWRQWRTVTLAFKELGSWEEFWARYGQEKDGKRVECSWTTLKVNIQKHRNKLDANDVARAMQQFGNRDSDEFAKHFSSVKSGRRTVMKSQQEIAHKFRIKIGEPNIWDQAF